MNKNFIFAEIRAAMGKDEEIVAMKVSKKEPFNWLEYSGFFCF